MYKWCRNIQYILDRMRHSAEQIQTKSANLERKGRERKAKKNTERVQNRALVIMEHFD